MKPAPCTRAPDHHPHGARKAAGRSADPWPASGAPPSAGSRWLGGAVLLGAALLAGCATPLLPGTGADGSGGTPTDQQTPAPAVVRAAPTSSSAPQVRPAVQAPVAVSTEPSVIALDPLDPTVRLNLDQPDARTDLWIRVREGFGMPDLDDEYVRKWEQYYAERPEYMQRMTERGGRYLFHIVEELERRHMPYELALLPFIESAFNPQAHSVARASGMWQFVPGTGRDFDLKQNLFRDDRRDVLASTQAALDYLQMLHGMFNDWHLALAAYNWGQGSVKRAIDRNERSGLPTGYPDLRMPDETRNYVPKLQAIKNIVARPEAFSLTLSPLKNHPYFITVAIERDIDVERAARMAELPLDEFKALNPQMNKPVILAAGTPQILLPYDNANRFVRALKARKGPLATWTAWVAPRTMKVAQAARAVGMSEADLRQANKIPPRMLVKAGSTLLIARTDEHGDVEESVADNARLALAPDRPPVRRVTVRAPRTESVARFARRYRLSAGEVAAWNRAISSGSRVERGQRIVLLLPTKAARAASRSARPASRAAARPSRAAAARSKARTSARSAKASSRQKASRTASRAPSARKIVKPSAALARSKQ